MDEENVTSEAGIQSYLKATVSRAQLLTAVGAGLALAAVPGGAGAAGPVRDGSAQRLEFPFYPAVRGTYSPENILDILNVLETVEMFLVTTTTFALTDLGSVTKEPALSVKQAKVAIGQYHLDYLESLGARPLLTTFTPRNRPGSGLNGEGDASLVIGAYMTAAREFAEEGQPLLVKQAFQAGSTWAEWRGATRALQNITPPNNKAFETDHWVYTRDIYKFYIEGTQFENSGTSRSGLRLTYPGREAVLAAAGPMASAVIQKTPNNAIVSTNGDAVRARGEAAALTGERGDTP